MNIKIDIDIDVEAAKIADNARDAFATVTSLSKLEFWGAYFRGHVGGISRSAEYMGSDYALSILAATIKAEKMFMEV